MRRPYHALAFSGIAGIASPASAFVANVAPTGVGRTGSCRIIGSAPRSPPPLAAGVAVEDGEAKPTHRERRGNHPSAATRARPLVHSQQVSPQEVRRRWPDSNFDVPVDLAGAAKTFFLGSPTPGLIVAGVMSVAALRVLWCGDTAPLGLADAVAVPVVAVGWSFQEWAIHKYLLHGLEDWLGHDVHEDHHDKPYYHVCVDPPDLVAGWTLAVACLFGLVLPPPLALTVLAVYMSMGLVYEWVHFFVHTRVVPRSQFGKQLKRHHTLHHLKDESCWLAFTAPAIDKLFGTLPPPRERHAPTAAAAAAAAAAATADADADADAAAAAAAAASAADIGSGGGGGGGER